MYTFNLIKFNVCKDVADSPYLHDIPAMQRRRLSKLAKLALHTARQTLENQSGVDYIVWSSCYGEEHKTVAILNEIADQQTPSPTQFSTSVHNAIAGLYSILYQDNTISTSVSSALNQTLSDAVLEAYSYLRSNQDDHAQALIVYYDEPLPNYYSDPHLVEEPIAVGLLISLAQPNVILKNSFSTNIQTSQQALELIKFWHSPEQIWQSGHWVWQKC